MKHLILLALLSFNANSQWYVDIGIGMTDEKNSKPEISLTNPLAKFTVGYQAQYNWSIEFQHISSIQMDEKGRGLNSFWITKRLYID